MNDFKAIAKTKDKEFIITKLSDIPEGFFIQDKTMFDGLGINSGSCDNIPSYVTIFINNRKPITINIYEWYFALYNFDMYDKKYIRNIIRRYNNICKELRLAFLEEFYYSL